jgi:hypothetical protein
MGGARRAYGGGGKRRVQGFGGNLREKDHWGDPSVDGRIVCIKKWNMEVRTGLMWLRKGTGGGHL